MKSNVDGVEYIPDSIEEEIHGDTFVEWYFSKEHPIFIRLKPDDSNNEYQVEVIAGINQKREQNVVTQRNEMSWEEATSIVSTLLYAMNGTKETINGNPEFNYSMTPPSEEFK